MLALQVDDLGVLRDSTNRVVTLRGINVDGSSKMPTQPNITTFTPIDETYWQGDKVSFVGRPFSLDHAPRHLERIRSWGYNVIRYVYSWEALEHEGPGVYDDEFIDYTIKVLCLMRDYDFYVFLDPHQDVWGRHSGGSGAPMWTYYAAGLDPRGFQATQAALVQNCWDDGPENFPKMIWATNYYRSVCQVMFTLFFAGREFAPNAVINGVNIQDFLQGHMLDAMVYFYNRIRKETDLFDACVFGVETMNEPNYGLIGFQDIGAVPDQQNLRLGTCPTAFESMLLATGEQVTVQYYSFGRLGPSRNGSRTVDPKGVSAWLQNDSYDKLHNWNRDPGWKLGECIWAQHGVWDPASKKLLKPDYFSSHMTNSVDEPYFVNVYFTRYWRNFYTAMRDTLGNDMFLLCQPPVMAIPPDLKDTDCIDNRVIYAPHFYDGLTVMLKKWNTFWNVDCLGYLRGKYSSPVFAIKIGESNIRKCIEEQITTMRDEGLEHMGPVPCLMSETGIPFDMDNRQSYQTGNFSSQIGALDAVTAGLEGARIHHAYWGYTSLNTNEYGDWWNGEDFSFWSHDSAIGDESEGSSGVLPVELNRGVRGKPALIRPFPTAVSGTIVSSRFDMKNTIYRLEVEGESSLKLDDTPTEIFIPEYHFGTELDVDVSSGKWNYDEQTSTLFWWHDCGPQSMIVTPLGSRQVLDNDICACTVM
jgi:hypothetical protein